jgi:hypothetical protein
MPFISSIRKNYDKPKTSDFEVTGGDLIYTAGGYRIHVFTQTGDANLNVLGIGDINNGTIGLRGTRLEAEFLVVGGGGASGPLNGGGGAGGYVAGTLNLAVGPYSVTVGSGGPAGSVGHGPARPDGSNSVFSTITAFGGIGGNNYRNPGRSGQGSGSGAGAWSAGGGGGAGGAGVGTGFTTQGPNDTVYTGGVCTTEQGFPGGQCFADSPNLYSGRNGPGGTGIVNSISGTAVAYAGGGGGGGHPGVYSDGNTVGGPGGGGPGNNLSNTPSSPGGTNTGGGGGGNGHSPDAPGTSGGPGIVIIRYKI